MSEKQPQGFWISIEGTHFGYVHVQAHRAAEAIDLILDAPYTPENHRITLRIDTFA